MNRGHVADQLLCNMATKATNVSLYYFLYYLKYSVKWSETKIVCRAQDVVIIDMFLIRNLFLSFFMFIVILQIHNICLVFVSLMVKYGYFRYFDFTILPLPRSDPTTDDLKSRVEFAGGTTVIRVK